VRSLGIIQARGGSKRLPRKNTKLLNGAPLISYAVRTGLASSLDRLIVTTEDDEIAELARRYGADVPFRRPDHLAADYASDEDILMHALDFCRDQEKRDYDIIVKLHPTTPFALPAHIDACIAAIKDTDANCCFTVRHVAEPPQWMFLVDASGVARTLLGNRIDEQSEHKQLLDKPYFPTGAAYAIRVSAFRARPRVFAEPLRVVTMEPLNSVDIDDELDFTLAELVGRKLGIGAPQP
jgi:CMP-N-acetylneuraminic acid synthetase